MDFCTGHKEDHDEIYKKARFKVRANETEAEVMTEERSGKFNIAKSSDYDDFYPNKEIKGDML